MSGASKLGGREKVLDALLACPECGLLPQTEYRAYTLNFESTHEWVLAVTCPRGRGIKYDGANFTVEPW